MPKLIFTPMNVEIDVAVDTKILAGALKAKVPIRFGCGSCRCGTCGVAVGQPKNLRPMADDERGLLTRLKLPTDGTVRLACRSRILKDSCNVDLDFQDTYSPAEYIPDDEDEDSVS